MPQNCAASFKEHALIKMFFVFYFSFQDENFVFEEFARQNLKDAGELKEEKTDQEAAAHE